MTSEALPKSQTLPAANQNTRPGPWIVGIVALFLIFGLAAQFAVRLDYGPDEPEHVEYVHALAWDHRLPDPSDTHLVQHPPVYYAALAVVWRAMGVEQRPSSITAGPGALAQMSARAVAGRRVLRFIDTLIGCITLLILARILTTLGVPATWQALLVALAAFSPLFQYIGGVVNNEGLSILYSAIICLVLVKRVVSGTCTLRDAALIGLLIGGCTLIKQTTLFAAPLALWALWTCGPSRERLPRLGIFILCAIALGIWWPLHNLHVAGTPFPCYTVPPNQAEQQALAHAHPAMFLEWFQNILATSILPDWSSMFVPPILSLGIAVLTCLLCLGVFIRGLADRQHPRNRQLRAMALTGLILLIAGILQYTYADDFRAQIGGRYLLDGLPWLITLLGAGIASRRTPPPTPIATTAGTDIPSAPATDRLGLIIALIILVFALCDSAWWLLAWTFYQSHYPQP